MTVDYVKSATSGESPLDPAIGRTYGRTAEYLNCFGTNELREVTDCDNKNEDDSICDENDESELCTTIAETSCIIRFGSKSSYNSIVLSFFDSNAVDPRRI